MSVQEFVEDDILNQINWDDLSDVYADCESLFGSDPAAPPPHNPSESCSDEFNASWIAELETKLMGDDDESEVDLAQNDGCSSDFLADILAGSPLAESDDVSTEKESSDEGNSIPSVEEMEKKDDDEKEVVAGNPSLEEVEKVSNDDSEGGDDPVSKKQRRQLRNRDAAVRSRERKKMYVRDLELKSSYMEGECRRLDRMLQFFIAENQALRLSLQNGNAFGVTSTKQESAVLLLESLLLGSLLWFLGTICCLFNLPATPQSDLVLVPIRNEGGKALEKTSLKGVRNKMILSSAGRCSVKSRKCKGSRTKMKWMSLCLCALA